MERHEPPKEGDAGADQDNTHKRKRDPDDDEQLPQGAQNPADGLTASTFELIHRGLHSPQEPDVIHTTQYGVLAVIPSKKGTRSVLLPAPLNGQIQVVGAAKTSQVSARVRAGYYCTSRNYCTTLDL